MGHVNATRPNRTFVSAMFNILHYDAFINNEVSAPVWWPRRPKNFEGLKCLTLGEQQYFCLGCRFSMHKMTKLYFHEDNITSITGVLAPRNRLTANRRGKQERRCRSKRCNRTHAKTRLAGGLIQVFCENNAVARVSEAPPEISRGAPHTLLAYYYELQ